MNVSAVVPVYNSINTLERAINSLSIQPEINEIFIVDDGSSDGSYEFVLELESKNPIIKVLTHSKRINRGAPASRNLGLNHCSNDWIQFLDSDDELLPSKVTSQILYIKSNTGVIVSPYFYVKNQASFNHDLFYKDDWSGLLMTMLGRTSSMLWNRIALNAVKWNEQLENVQEYYLIFDLLRNGYMISYCPEYHTKVYYHKSSISNILSAKKRDNLIVFRENVKSFLEISKKLTWMRYYYFNVSVGKVYRNFSPAYKIKYNKFVYFLYRVFAKIKHLTI